MSAKKKHSHVDQPVDTGGDKIAVGDISGSIGVAIGHGARTTVTVDEMHQSIGTLILQARSAVEEAERAQSVEAQRLAQGVSTFVQGLQALVAEPAQGGNPYKGLLEYRLNDTEVFSGRAQAIQEFSAVLQRGPLTVLHAESGAGKTSLLQAGIAPRLLADGHLPVYVRPYNVNPALAVKRAFVPALGRTPGLRGAPLHDFLHQVCAKLPESTQLVIFVDQFEEFFVRLDEPERQAFVDELAECLDDEALPVHWVLALRAESFSELAAFRPRIRAPFGNDYRLNRLARAEAQDAIVKPAERRGVRFEAKLVKELLDELSQGERGEIAPPQIQLVCSALYAELESGKRVISWSLYEEQGEAEGILRGYLERVLSRDLLPEQRAPARRLLDELVTADGRRALRPRSELVAALAQRDVSAEIVDAILSQLTDSRLLRVQEGGADEIEWSYELVHDYLLGEIELDPEVQARKAAQELLEHEVRAYRRLKSLMSAERLAVIEQYRDQLRFTPEATKLLSKSRKAVRQEIEAERKRQEERVHQAEMLAEEQRRRAEVERQATEQAQHAAARLRRRAATAIAVGALAVIAAVAAVVFGRQAVDSEQKAVAEAISRSTAQAGAVTAEAAAKAQRDEAVRQADIALARQLAAQAQVTFRQERGDAPLLGALLAAESHQRLPSPEAYLILQEALGILPAPVARMAHDDVVNAVAFSSECASPPEATAERCGKQVVTGSQDGTARVWEATTGREVARMAHGGGVTAVAFSPRGQWVVSGSVDKTARVWDISTSLPGLTGGAGNAGAASGREVARLTHDAAVTAVAFSLGPACTSPPEAAAERCGQWVVSGSADKTARVWEASSGREVARLTHDGEVTAVAFSPEGKWVVSGSSDGTARVWDISTSLNAGAASGREVARLTHDAAVTAVAFSPEGKWVVTSSLDGTARVWEASSGREVARMTHDGEVTAAAFSPGPACASPPEATAERCGQWVVSGSLDGTARVWEAATGREIARMSHYWGVRAVAFSPGPACASPPEAAAERCGKWVASGGVDTMVRVWLWQPADMIAAICARLPRNFSPTEWTQYLGDVPYRAICPNLPAPG